MDFERMIRFYRKQVAGDLKLHGPGDWRAEMNQRTIDRLVSLQNKTDLSAEDHLFLQVKEAVTEAFTKR